MHSFAYRPVRINFFCFYAFKCLNGNRWANKVDRKKTTFWQWCQAIQSLIYQEIAKVSTEIIICIGQAVLFDHRWPGPLITNKAYGFDLFNLYDFYAKFPAIQIQRKMAVYSDPEDLKVEIYHLLSFFFDFVIQVAWKEIKWDCPLTRLQMDDRIVEMCHQYAYIAASLDQMETELAEEDTLIEYRPHLFSAQLDEIPPVPSFSAIPMPTTHQPTPTLAQLDKKEISESSPPSFDDLPEYSDEDEGDSGSDPEYETRLGLENSTMEARRALAIARHHVLMPRNLMPQFLGLGPGHANRSYVMEEVKAIPNNTPTASMSHDPAPLPQAIRDRFMLERVVNGESTLVLEEVD
jgi:hypothetical protein